VQEVSDEILRFAWPLRHPAALRVLLALEETPRGVAELCQVLDLQADAVEYVVLTLTKAGLVEKVRVEPADAHGRTTRWIYGTCHHGWEGVRQAFADLRAKPRPVTS
jgi:DNA-binding transcriptional ArsR family regulator